MLEKEQLLAFFEKASSKYNECSFARCLEGKTPEEVEEIISNVQKEVFSEMNIDEELGFESLGQISEAFEDDYSFMRRFYKFVMEEADIGDKVVMSSEEYSKKCERVEQFTKATENKIAASTNLDSKEEDTLYIDLYRMIIAIAGDSEEYESDGNEHENEDEHDHEHDHDHDHDHEHDHEHAHEHKCKHEQQHEKDCDTCACRKCSKTCDEP